MEVVTEMSYDSIFCLKVLAKNVYNIIGIIYLKHFGEQALNNYLDAHGHEFCPYQFVSR